MRGVRKHVHDAGSAPAGSPGRPAGRRRAPAWPGCRTRTRCAPGPAWALRRTGPARPSGAGPAARRRSRPGAAARPARRRKDWPARSCSARPGRPGWALPRARATSAASPSSPSTRAPRRASAQAEIADAAEQIGHPLAGLRRQQVDRQRHQLPVDGEVHLREVQRPEFDVQIEGIQAVVKRPIAARWQRVDRCPARPVAGTSARHAPRRRRPVPRGRHRCSGARWRSTSSTVVVGGRDLESAAPDPPPTGRRSASRSGPISADRRASSTGQSCHVGQERRPPLAKAHQHAAAFGHPPHAKARPAPVMPGRPDAPASSQCRRLHAADARQLVGQLRLLVLHLGGVVLVLQRAAAAALIGRAGRRHALRRAGSRTSVTVASS